MVGLPWNPLGHLNVNLQMGDIAENETNIGIPIKLHTMYYTGASSSVSHAIFTPGE